jgi:hypothetical protein
MCPSLKAFVFIVSIMVDLGFIMTGPFSEHEFSLAIGSHLQQIVISCADPPHEREQ